MKLRGGMQSIPLVRFSLLAVILASLLSSCVVGTERIGRPIIDEEVAMIRDGETTAPQILRLLGAPDLQSNLAGDLLYVYRYCEIRTVRSHVHQDRQESCDELSVIFDNETSKVKAHSLERMQPSGP